MSAAPGASASDSNAELPTARQWYAAERPAPNALATGSVSALPRVNTWFLGFRLIGVLGRGASGQVYLAEQGDLAGRYVALKIAPDIFDESQTLAQLQHTNIMPIYSVHCAAPLQAVCMP